MNKSNGIHQDRIKAPLLRPKDKINRRYLLKLILPGFKAAQVPFERLQLDGSRCTGCGLCTQECSTKALIVSSSEKTDEYQLLFRHDLCVACSRCIQVCPEQCLYSEHAQGLDKIDDRASLLFESEIARCRACGDFIGSKAMINGLQVRLQTMGSSLALQLELCPTCKIKQSILGRTALVPDARPD